MPTSFLTLNKLCSLPTHCVRAFLMILRTNSDCFSNKLTSWCVIQEKWLVYCAVTNGLLNIIRARKRWLNLAPWCVLPIVTLSVSLIAMSWVRQLFVGLPWRMCGFNSRLLWYTKWQWTGFTRVLRLILLVSFYHRCTSICSSIVAVPS